MNISIGEQNILSTLAKVVFLCQVATNLIFLTSSFACKSFVRYGWLHWWLNCSKVPSVIVMPPLGEAPPNSPQPGQPGGGEVPGSNAFAASLAPPGEEKVMKAPNSSKEA